MKRPSRSSPRSHGSAIAAAARPRRRATTSRSRCSIAPDTSRSSRCSSTRTAICLRMPAAKSCSRWRASSAAFPFRFASSRTSIGMMRSATKKSRNARSPRSAPRLRLSISRVSNSSPPAATRRGTFRSPTRPARSTAAWTWKFGDNRAAMQQPQYVYYFGDGHADGNAKMKDVLGGKGAGLAEMTNIGVPVPPGFTISTAVCTYFYAHGKTYPPELNTAVAANLAPVETSVGRKFGDAEKPLLVSVRSGARASMPGMMDTILNLGLNDETVQGLAKSSKDERFALDSYRRFIQMYSGVVLELDKDLFEHELFALRDKSGVKTDAEIPAGGLRGLVETYKGIVREKTGNDFPQDVQQQLWGAIGAVFNSWNNQRAITYRKLNQIPYDWA